MRKTLLCFILLVACMFKPAMAQTVNPFYQLPQLKSIQIDGADKDWRNKGLAIPLVSDYTGKIAESTNFAADVRLGWDAENLYFFAKVTDNKIYQQKRGPIKASDAFEFFISTLSEKAPIVQYIVFPSLTNQYPQTIVNKLELKSNKSAKNVNDIKVASSITPSGYNLEVCIPFSVIQFQALKDKRVKFNFFVHDADAEKESTTYSWHYFPNTYINHDAMYTLQLVGSKKQKGLLVRAHVANNTNYNFQLLSYKSTAPKSVVRLKHKDATLTNASFVKKDRYAFANFSFTKPDNVDLKTPLLIACQNKILSSISWYDIPHAGNPTYKPTRFEEQIFMFEKEDAKQFPPVGATLFIGSSSIRLWKTLEADFPELKVINRGFGGSSTPDVLYYFDRIVKPYKPAKIVYYTGTNDLASGINPVEVTSNIEKFIQKVEENLPQTKIYVLNHSLAVSRKSLSDNFNEANRLLQEMIRNYPNANYVEVAKSVQFHNGMPRPDFFSADSTHMNADGYQKWKEVLRPILIK